MRKTRAKSKNRQRIVETAERLFHAVGVRAEGVRAVGIDRISPDTWGHVQPLLDRPGKQKIQLSLFHSYGSNPRSSADDVTVHRKILKGEDDNSARFIVQTLARPLTEN